MMGTLADFIRELRDGTQPGYERSDATNYVLSLVLEELESEADTNPFSYQENRAAYVLYQHVDWALICLSRSLGLRDYAEVVLRKAALDHLQRAKRAARQIASESTDHPFDP